MKKSNKKGFTLVELVVVIAIIGVLAAILVPSMMGYVKKSRLKTANSNAKTAYNAVSTFVADQETKGEPVIFSVASGTSGTSVNCAPSAYDCKSASASGETSMQQALHKVVYDALADNGKEAGIAHVGAAEINDKNTFFVQWRKTSSDTMIGQYPNAIADVDTSESITFGSYKS